MNKICKKPDRDVSEIICGHPLPCPYHTVTIKLTGDPPTITIPATILKKIKPKTLRRLKIVAKILEEER